MASRLFFRVSSSIGISILTTWFEPGDLIVIDGPPVNKTALALNFVRIVACFGISSLILSPEVIGGQKLMDFLVSKLTGIPWERLQSGDSAENEWPQVKNACKNARGLIEVDNTLSSLPSIRSKVKRWQASSSPFNLSEGPGIVVIDVFGITPKDGNLPEIRRQLKAIAKDVGVPIVALLNRGIRQQSTPVEVSAMMYRDEVIQVSAMIYRDEVN